MTSKRSTWRILECIEYQIEAEAEYVFRYSGAQGLAYPAIVGLGNACQHLALFLQSQQDYPGSIVVFDFAADLDHMTMDITRTFNIDGKFTPEQAKWYNVDLECQKAVIDMLRVGNTYEQAAEAGKKVFDREGIGSQWYGWPGHFVGSGHARRDDGERSDPGRAGGHGRAYRRIPDKHWHFRVEDTILITPTGQRSYRPRSEGNRRRREDGGHVPEAQPVK